MDARASGGRDVRLLFAARTLRLFAYGLLSVVLVLHLTAAGLDEREVGLLLTLTLAGDTAISLWLTTRADRLGRRRTLLLGAALMVLAGLAFAGTTDFWLLLAAATVGVLSPSGNEVGPFLAVEQAALAERVPAERRTGLFAWYNLAGSFATAAGALAGGALAQALLYLSRDSALRDRLGQAARRTVVPFHTWNRVVQSILDLAAGQRARAEAGAAHAFPLPHG